MESMTVHLLSLVERGDIVEARARVLAAQARLHVHIWFARPIRATKRELWQRARDEVLRYLDVA